MILLSIALLAAMQGQAPAATLPGPGAEVSELLKRKTQAFSDAGQRGDGVAMAAMLDPDVVFFNEGGDRATRAEMAETKPSGAPASVTMTVEDWSCRVFGDVAVASFVDDQRIAGPGAPFHARYRSVETWRREAGDWRMIASETLALTDDPPSVALTPAQLDDYVGDYRSAAGQTFSFSREGDRLLAHVAGGAATAQAAEVRDVLFTPGRARFRKVFTRDAQGRVDGFAYRREGHDTRFERVGGARS